MQNEVLPLPIRFEANGFLYWQICRTNQAAIYEQRMPDGRRVFYEVWRIRIRQAHDFKERHYPTAEKPPTANEWGHFGWTYYTLHEAQKRYDQINGWTAVMESFEGREGLTVSPPGTMPLPQPGEFQAIVNKC